MEKLQEFTIFPAIDMHAGQVVRLAQGDLNKKTTYSLSPAVTARRWLGEGARWLHCVNLDGAFGQPDQKNRVALQTLLQVLKAEFPGAKVQLGGGLRSLEDIAAALDSGINRVILGTLAVEQPRLVEEALQKWGAEAIGLAIDAFEGALQVRGWTVDTGIDAQVICCRFARVGLRTVVYTDIARDGVSLGINIKASRRLSDETGLFVIASGGAASLLDVHSAKQAGLSGIILGRSLYEGRINLKEALEC